MTLLEFLSYVKFPNPLFNNNSSFFEINICAPGKILSEIALLIISIGFDGEGNWYNVNADEASAGIAQLLDAELIFMTDVEAVLDNKLNPLHHLSSDEISKLIDEGVIKGGMQVKVNTSLQAAQHLRRGVYISSWQKPENLIALLNGEHVGTQITP